MPGCPADFSGGGANQRVGCRACGRGIQREWAVCHCSVSSVVEVKLS